jgi:hypothetical protein
VVESQAGAGIVLRNPVRKDDARPFAQIAAFCNEDGGEAGLEAVQNGRVHELVPETLGDGSGAGCIEIQVQLGAFQQILRQRPSRGVDPKAGSPHELHAVKRSWGGSLDLDEANTLPEILRLQLISSVEKSGWSNLFRSGSNLGRFESSPADQGKVA